MIGEPSWGLPDEDIHETADGLLEGLGADRALGHAVVLFTGDGDAGVGFGTPDEGGGVATMAEMQLLTLLVRAISERHEEPPEKVADAAVSILKVEDVLNMTVPGGRERADLDDMVDIDIGGVRHGDDEESDGEEERER